MSEAYGEESEYLAQRWYIEDPDVDLDAIVASLDKHLENGSLTFVDTSVFDFPSEYLKKVSVEHLDALILERYLRFANKQRHMLEKYPNIALTTQVMSELAQFDRSTQKAIVQKAAKRANFITGQNQDTLQDDAYKLIELCGPAFANLFSAADTRVRAIDDRREPIRDVVLDLVKFLDSMLNLKKQGSKSDTDERIVSAALTEALFSSTPVSVISRDNDVNNLLRAGYNALTSPEIKSRVRHLMEDVRIVNVTYDRSLGEYVPTVLRPNDLEDDWNKQLNATTLELVKNKIKSTLTTLDALIQKHPPSAKLELQEMDEVVDRRETKRSKKRARLHPRDDYVIVDRVYKRRRRRKRKDKRNIGLRGRSIGVRMERDTTVHNGERSRRFKLFGDIPFSGAFTKDFGYLIVNDKASREEDTQYMPPKTIVLPKEVIRAIDDLVFKYRERDDNREEYEAHKFGIGLARRFYENNNSLRRLGISLEEKSAYCQRFIEYAFFLRSIYGPKDIPVEISDFVTMLDENGQLDNEKLWQKTQQSAADFDVSVKQGSLENILPKFERFIRYRVLTQYSDALENPAMRESAFAALKEAVVRYNITEDNLSINLKIALQHVDWGLSQAYNRIQANKKQNAEAQIQAPAQITQGVNP